MSTAKQLLAKRLQQNTVQHSNAQKEQLGHVKEFRKNIHISDIRVSPNQPRQFFDEKEIEDLASSIQEIGLLQPISVRRLSQGFELIAGERRLKAHQFLKKTTIEAIVLDISDEDASLFTLAENLKREDLTDYEIYLGLSSLDQQIKQNKTKLARSLGMNREDMYKYLSFEKIPQYMHESLKKEPKLIGRVVATAIKKYLTQYQTASSKEILNLIWQKFLKGQIEQTKIITQAEKQLHQVTTAPNFVRTLEIDQQKIGKISFSDQKLKVNLTLQQFNENDYIELERFLTNMIISKNKKV